MPKGSKDIVEVGNRDIEKEIKEKKLPRYIRSTACWRGYIGTWEVKNGKLYLNEIVGLYKKLNPEPLFAEWFTGVLRIPKGERLLAINMGFASVHEKELHIKIERGAVVKEREIANSSKELDRNKLASQNLPGSENKFEGDDI
ncbi:MAG: hypothetical protein MZV65_12940 [Chromatiales bacterium]|nr:hypothetical protein [Chromatiales bacterium]